MELFRSEKTSPTVTRIAGASGELMYLVEGDEKAMLLDAGVGAGDLAAYVKTLTTKPVELLLTHGHLDHIGAAPLFETVYLNEADWPLAREHSAVDARLGYTTGMPGAPALTAANFVPAHAVRCIPLRNGDCFDLGGGISVQALALPGHTRGSMAVLMPHERSILLGDACNTFTFLFDENTLPVAAYKDSLLAFCAAHRAAYDRVYLSHGPGDVDSGVLEGVIGVCDDILAGNTDDLPFDFMGGSYTIAKAMNAETMERTDGGVGNIVYSKSRLR